MYTLFFSLLFAISRKIRYIIEERKNTGKLIGASADHVPGDGTYAGWGSIFGGQEGSESLVSSQVLQKTIDELRAITRIDLSVLSVEGQILVTTRGDESLNTEHVREFVQSPADSQVMQGYHFFKVYDDQAVEYVLVARGNSEDAYMIGKIAVCQIQNLIIAYKERLDKNNFIQNLLLDNLLMVDVYNRAKKLRIETDVKRVVFMVETKYEKDNSAMETIKSLYASKPKDFITAVDEKNIIIVKELKDTDSYEELNQIARTLVDMLNVEAMSQVRVSYGNMIREIKDVSRSYKEAKTALEVGKIFYADKVIVPYNNLGIGRLIYQLPIPLCQMFMREVFGKQLPDTFDDETLTTINKFFENNLNVSETSRQLYVHRNTLVYRLEKLQKSTGLDIRVFDDALTFKIAMMVVSYMKYMENQD